MLSSKVSAHKTNHQGDCVELLFVAFTLFILEHAVLVLCVFLICVYNQLLFILADRRVSVFV